MKHTENREDIIVASLLKLGTFLTREGNRLLGSLGINQQQFVVLRHIQNREPVNQKEICSQLVFEKSNVSKIIKKLILLQLVEMETSPLDSRVRVIYTTPKGKQLVKEGMTIFQAWNHHWLSSLSDTEQMHAELVLDKLSRLA